MKVCILALVVATLTAGVLAATSMASDRPVATAARVGQHGVETRFVVDLSAAVPYRLFTLSNPYRLAIDLPAVDWSTVADEMRPERGLIAAVRAGHLRPGASRIVLDLAAPFRIKDSFMLAPGDGFPHRLVVDLAPADSSAPQNRTASIGGTASQVAGVPIPRMKPYREPPRVIVVDAGHGGQDPGAIGRSGIREKDVVLAAAREIRKRLEATGRYTVMMTRDDDRYLKLRDRVGIARRADADLFISLHADAHPQRATRGVSVYTLSERASDAEAAALAEKENKSDIIAGFDLSDQGLEVTNILIDLAQRETMNRSAMFAKTLVHELGLRVAVLRRSHRFAGFAVLKAPDIPSVLVELGYLSNGEEERLLKTGAHRALIVEGIAAAIDDYFAGQLRLARS